MAAGGRRLSVRVLLVDLESDWRGGQSQALLLMQGLRARGHAVELLSVADAALATRACAQGIPVHSAPQRARRLGAARLLRKLLGNHEFDVVHANEAHALTAAWVARANHYASLTAARRVTFPLSRSAIALARYEAAARILAVSAAVREQLLAAQLAPERINVIADGVEIPPATTSAERAEARTRWKIAAGTDVLAFVAHLTEEKGHALLIDAFAELLALRGGGRGLHLLLAGDGPLRNELERRVRTASLQAFVTFAGFVEDVRPVYAACDVFMFPSLNEGGGTSLLTAMAYALPVVAAASGGIKEIVADGCNGLLVHAAEFGQIKPNAIAHATARLLDDAEFAGRLGTAARETVATRFSAEHMVSETIAVFANVIGTGGSESKKKAPGGKS
jgi:glycosyltransferase involved in cell wall biosynthesis